MIVNNKSGLLVIGRISKEPEDRETSGGSVTRFSVCYGVDETTTNAAGRHPGKFLDVDAWGELGQCCLYLSKGDSVMVSGHMKSREWNGKTYHSVTADAVFPCICGVERIAQSAGGGAPVLVDGTTGEVLNDAVPEYEAEDDGEVPF